MAVGERVCVCVYEQEVEDIQARMRDARPLARRLQSATDAFDSKTAAAREAQRAAEDKAYQEVVQAGNTRLDFVSLLAADY